MYLFNNKGYGSYSESRIYWTLLDESAKRVRDRSRCAVPPAHTWFCRDLKIAYLIPELINLKNVKQNNANIKRSASQ